MYVLRTLRRAAEYFELISTSWSHNTGAAYLFRSGYRNEHDRLLAVTCCQLLQS